MNLKKLAITLGATAITLTAAAEGIATQGGSIRCSARADINNREMIYLSEESGALSLNALNGAQSWYVPSDNHAVMFELVAHDIDADGDDDLLAVSGNGSVYAYSSKGKLLWKFTTEEISRLSQIAVIGEGKESKIFAAGNNYKLYELDSRGKLLSTTPIQGCARSLESGNFVDTDTQVLYLHTYTHDKYNSKFWGFIDPTTKEVIKSGDIRKVLSNGQMVNDIEIADVNGDGLDDVLLFSTDRTCTVTAVDSNLAKIFKFSGSKDFQRYAAARGTALPERSEIVVQYGGVIYLISNEGKQIARAGEPNDGLIYTDFLWLPKAQVVTALGQASGDNSFYTFETSSKSWISQEQTPVGIYADVQQNINNLYSQALKFEMPAYQSKSRKPFVVLGLKDSQLNAEVARLKGGEIVMVSESNDFGEVTPRTEMQKVIGDAANMRDRRKKYKDNPDQIVAWAAEQERKGQPFQLWVGHGTDPFYVQIATLERIVAAAPTMCYGFIYAEMHDSTNPAVKYFIDEYMPRIAKAIRANKAVTKVYFRYKNMFWAADTHEPEWQKIFLSGDYRDIVVPSAEDTNNRLQDLNLAGRVGMYMSGYIDNFAMRLVDDNPTSWRPLSQGGQRSVSPYLRSAVIAAAYGSSHGVLFPSKYIEQPSYNVLFALIKSGALPMVEAEDILSVGSWHLVRDLDQEYVHQVNDTGHNLLTYSADDDNAVIGKAGVQWCGATTSAHDYSRVSLGVEYRWLNFMPAMPNGMVPITSYAHHKALDKSRTNYVVSDIKSGYDGNQKIDAQSFGKIMEESVQGGASQMLMRVDGASWALIRVGEKQARLILVDNGYVSPENRTATVKLQNISPIECTDILANQNIKISGNTLKIEVPAGSVRFIDFEYDKKI